MRRRFPHPLRGRGALVGIAVALLVGLAAPAGAGAALGRIDGTPLDIYADGLGAVQFAYDNDPGTGIFAPAGSLGATPPAAAKAGLEISIGGTSYPLGGANRVTTVAPTVTRPLSQFGLVTSEYDLVSGGTPVLHVKEEIAYTDSSPIVIAQYALSNPNPSVPLNNVRVGVLGDIYLRGDNAGTGTIGNTAPSRIMTATNSATGVQVGLLETTPWAHYQEGASAGVFDSFRTATLADTVSARRVTGVAVGAEVDYPAVPAADGSATDFDVAWLLATTTPDPQPVAGETVTAKTLRGVVKVKVPGGQFVDLSQATSLPLGTIFDTTHGRVTLTSAADAKGTTQKAWFYSGLFKVGQTKGAKPITTLELTGAKPRCARGSAAATGAFGAKAKAKSRRLWGDGKGRFQTKGELASATVRGTKWYVEDTCAGTLTRVERGSVTVRDFVCKRTVVVTAGPSYLARR